MSGPEELSSVEPSDDSAPAGWAMRLRELVAGWFGAADERTAASLRGETWILLYGIVAMCVRSRARSLRSLGADDQRDIAAQKALDLMRQLDARSWDPTRAAPEQVRAYVVFTARHALLDYAGSRSRDVVGFDETEGAGRTLGGSSPTQEATIDSRACAAAIVACLSSIPERNRAAWCLRVLLELTSEQIGRHPLVRMTPGAVDVLLFRVRAVMRRCLLGKGVDAKALPTGTYVRLWESLEADRGMFRGTGGGP